MDQVATANFSPSPIFGFEPFKPPESFEPGTYSGLESPVLDDQEFKDFLDELNDRSGNWRFFIEAIAQSFASFASKFLTIP